ncbi:MAG: cupin domain-containing protein [Chloroflexi bacterium]|nr:cupin domain-containing protein [Chloroflexota bacterium]
MIDDRENSHIMLEPSLTMEEVVGNQLRSFRTARGFSLKALSEKSGLNINTLSLIENGKISPSVSTLQQLSSALDISISAFFETTPEPKSIVYMRYDERRCLRIGEVLLENLTEGFSDSTIQSFVVSLPPGSGSGTSPVVHTGQECVLCLEGCLEYTVVDDGYVLFPGDSLVFQAHLPHQWKNPGNGAAKFVLTISSADKHEEHGGRHFSIKPRLLEKIMKIAVISDDGKDLSQHFGRAPYYIVFTIEDGKIVQRDVREKLGHNQFGGGHHEHEHSHEHGQDAASHGKHVSMAEAISDCEAVICGGMGMGAYESLKRLNIKPIVTDMTDVEAAVKAYIDGNLIDHTEKLH